MQSAVEFHHIERRLAIIHLSGIAAFVLFFILLFILGSQTSINTLPSQIVTLSMAGILLLSYAAHIFSNDHGQASPLFFFFLLNIATSVLVWSTGILQSPFIIFYIILIITTSQLYHYKYGLLQSVIALAGFVFVYGATSFRLLPYLSLVPDTEVFFLYQPPIIMFVYGMLYAILFIFTVFSTSSARIILFRPSPKNELNSTFHEQIINAMPLGVMVVDNDLTILGANAAATRQCPIESATLTLDHYITMEKIELKKMLILLTKNKKESDVLWLTDTGKNRRIMISVEMHKGIKKESDTFILFIQPNETTPRPKK